MRRVGWGGDIAMKENKQNSSEAIAMAWCDKTSFESIRSLTGLSEKEIIVLMRKTLKPSSFHLWRKRVSGRLSKHEKKYRRPR